MKNYGLISNSEGKVLLGHIKSGVNAGQYELPGSNSDSNSEDIIKDELRNSISEKLGVEATIDGFVHHQEIRGLCTNIYRVSLSNDNINSSYYSDIIYVSFDELPDFDMQPDLKIACSAIQSLNPAEYIRESTDNHPNYPDYASVYLDDITDFSIFDWDLSQFEFSYNEINCSPRTVKFIDELGKFDMHTVRHNILSMIVSEFPYLQDKLSYLLDSEDGLSSFLQKLTNELKSSGVSDSFGVKYMKANPIIGLDRSAIQKCSACSLDPVEKYGALGIGVITNYYDEVKDKTYPVCPTCKALLTNRTNPISIDTLLAFINKEDI